MKMRFLAPSIPARMDLIKVRHPVNRSRNYIFPDFSLRYLFYVYGFITLGQTWPQIETKNEEKYYHPHIYIAGPADI